MRKSAANSSVSCTVSVARCTSSCVTYAERRTSWLLTMRPDTLPTVL